MATQPDPTIRYPFSCSPVFDMVMRDAGLCRRFLERVLGTEVGKITYHTVEYEVAPGLEKRGVRLDAYLKSEDAVYNIEMQASPELALGRRMRYYQSAIDTFELGAGMAFEELPESYVIFVCDHDPYNARLPVYDLERMCVQDGSVQVGAGSHWRVLNAAAWRDEPDAGLRAMLEYVAEGNASDELTRELDAAVDAINADPKRRAEVGGFMTQEMSWGARMRIARKEGRAEGEARYRTLFDRMFDDGRIEELREAGDDSSLLHRLYAEYGL